MGGFSLWHWLILGVIVLLLFGKASFSNMMGDVAKGIKQFKKGMAEDDEEPVRTQSQVQQQRLQAQPPVEPAASASPPELQPMKDDRPPV